MAIVWSLQLRLAFANNDNQEITAIKESPGSLRFEGGTAADFAIAFNLSELNNFLLTIGFGSNAPGPFPSNLNDYSFRFVAITTNGGIEVLGGSKDLNDQVITGNLDAVLADLNADPEFVSFMTDITARTATATALMEAVGILAVAAGGSVYLVNDEITLAGGTFSEAAVLRVASVGTVAGQDETDYSAGELNGTFTGGSGYSVGNVNTMSDGSTITVDAITTIGEETFGVITAFTITTSSTSGLANDATITQVSSTGEGATGFSMTLDINNQAVFSAAFKMVAEAPVSGTYSVIPPNPVAQGSTTGSGTGATFNMDWGVKSVVVTDGGQEYVSVPAVSFSGGTGSAATATLTGDAVSSVTVTTPGSGHAVTTTVTIAAP